ncbi:MAG: hypothetical protein WAT20_04655 [Ferruginibacter sp.]|nr:hypothetical protein [Chitinophagaceae bacterium]
MENRNDILNELKELSLTIAAMEKVNVFAVPQGYFEHLAADILMGIETENGSAIASPAGDVPAGYFENLAGSILAKIKTQQTEDAATEIRALSPMLYSIQSEHVFEVPAGYFEGLSETVLNTVNPQVKVVSMKRRTTAFFKYAVAAAFTGVMALGVFKFTGNTNEKIELPAYVTDGLKMQDVDQELAKISDADIVKFLEANGTDVKTAMVAGSIDEHELPSQEDYLLDEKALDKYLNTINIDELKN